MPALLNAPQKGRLTLALFMTKSFIKNMLSSTNHNKKGGRPHAEQKRCIKLSTHCTLLEQSLIQAKAKSVNTSISELLRKMTLEGVIIVKSYPLEILKITTQLNHIAANVNGIAKRVNFNEPLSFDDLNDIRNWPEELMKLSKIIKESLK
jgi:hypothetical protein